MGAFHIGDRERQFTELIWRLEPVPSGDLVKAAREELGWAKSTTYTVLRRLAHRGLVENRDGTVRSLVSMDQFAAGQAREIVDEQFGGSLPDFLAAFSDGRALSEEETAELERFIEEKRRS